MDLLCGAKEDVEEMEFVGELLRTGDPAIDLSGDTCGDTFGDNVNREGEDMLFFGEVKLRGERKKEAAGLCVAALSNVCAFAYALYLYYFELQTFTFKNTSTI